MPNIKLEHSGEYICEAVGYSSSTPGQSTTVTLRVEKCKQNLIILKKKIN